ncbi:MAG: ATP-binding cassette domain-containing protein [Deltaproteobacteria bacterium]|nr:ATP-binding cassette domain-containing protein [Deltaproteobacteria bacterium]
MIETSKVTKDFGSLRALDKVSFQVRRGEVVGFLGPNGAGKSTTMRILTCYISATSGSVRVNGHDVFDAPLEVRRSLGYLPQRAPLYGDMSVWEYLRFVAQMRQLDASSFRKRMRSVVEVCGLARSLGTDIRTLSHGYRQRVGLAQALVHDPPILVLDEPTSDLDPNEKAEVVRYIKEIGKERTVVLSTHNLAEVEAACARAIIISKGRLVADGNLEDIRARSGRVRYVVVIDETKGLRNGAPSAEAAQQALVGLGGTSGVKELPTDERAHAFELMAPGERDLRPEIYRMAVERGWLLLEMRRDSQKLEDVFKALTRGDEVAERGRPLAEEAEAEPDEGEAGADEDEEDEEEEEGSDDEAAPEEEPDEADEPRDKKD